MNDERIAALKERFREKIKERRAAERARVLAPPPRYDDVYFEGVAWLNALADEEVTRRKRRAMPSAPPSTTWRMGNENPRQAPSRARGPQSAADASEDDMKLIPVAPIGTRRSVAFVCGPRTSGLRDTEEPTYPPSPRGDALRELRAREGDHVTIGEAARLLGIGPADLCSLEYGRATLSDEDWIEAERLIRELKARKANT